MECNSSFTRLIQVVAGSFYCSAHRSGVLMFPKGFPPVSPAVCCGSDETSRHTSVKRCLIRASGWLANLLTDFEKLQQTATTKGSPKLKPAALDYSFYVFEYWIQTHCSGASLSINRTQCEGSSMSRGDLCSVARQQQPPRAHIESAKHQHLRWCGLTCVAAATFLRRHAHLAV